MIANSSTLNQPVIPPHPSAPYNRWLAAWDRSDYLELGSFETAPGSARGHVANVLLEWRLGRLADSMRLVVSELVTNSVLATGAVSWSAKRPPVRVWTLGGSSSVLVLVWDAVDGAPVRREAGEADESGRGLAIVDALSARWDFYRPAAPFGGKVTWALVDSP